MQKNKSWVEENKEVVIEVIQQLNETPKPPKKFSNDDNKLIKFFKNRER